MAPSIGFIGVGAIAAWVTAHNATQRDATTYGQSLFRALSETAVRTDAADLPGLVGRHETPGDLNERVRRGLEDNGWFDALGQALDRRTRLPSSEREGMPLPPQHSHRLTLTRPALVA